VSNPPSPSFEQFEASLSRLGGVSTVDPIFRERFRALVTDLSTAKPTVEHLSHLIEKQPDLVPVLGLVVGLSQEALKNTLRYRLGSSGWTQLARTRATDVVALLNDEFKLLPRLNAERSHQWDYADILLERAGSRGLAGRAIGRGKALEDRVELLVGKQGLDLPYKLRTRFIGTGGRSAPCDVAIPDGGEKALIAIAIKGFDSTGSKLTDAVREVVTMAEIRQPRQFVYAVVDGIGWKSRKADLHRIYDLWSQNLIAGVYSLAYFDEFRSELESAVRRLNFR
jgi:DpnII restriction endonuclease